MRAPRVSRGPAFKNRDRPMPRTPATTNSIDDSGAESSSAAPIKAFKRIFGYIFPLAYADLLRTLPRMRRALA